MLRSKKNFNKHDWLEKRKSRKYMVNSLKESKLLIGLIKNEVIKILGDEYNDSNSSKWFYFIGKKTSYLKSICTFILISLVKYVKLKPKMLHTHK